MTFIYQPIDHPTNQPTNKYIRGAFISYCNLYLYLQMHQQGILKTDDLITRFFRLCTEMCVDLCYRALTEQTHSPTLIRAKCFHTLDAFVRLIALLVKHSGDTANTVTKLNLLNKVCCLILCMQSTKFVLRRSKILALN